MEFWFIITVSISIAAILKAFINLFFPNKISRNLPPGPLLFPFIGNLLLLLKSKSGIEPVLRNLHAKLGPIVTLRVGSHTAIFIADRSLAHKALVQNGAVFADRPPALPISQVTSSNQHNVSSAFYGATWRALRRNLTAEIMHPSRVRSYSHARKWVLQILLDRFKLQSKNGDTVRVMDHFQYAMFCLLVLMCFGDKLEQKRIEEIENVQRGRLLALGPQFNILNFCPRLTKIVFRRKWKQLFHLLEDQKTVLVPLIRERQRVKEERLNKYKEDDEYVSSYVDTLLDLELPEEKRKLDEQEIVNLCSEFLTAGTDTTSTALQWIMANLVKNPDIQQKLFLEIKGVIEDGQEEVKEEDLQKLPYLKAVILEGLRRHPPGHFVVPHAVTEDFKLDRYVIPKYASINFAVAEIGRDPKVWEDPMAFKPQRFQSDENGGVDAFDITGSREIKMMPFGVGRRICPGLSLAMLHLEYFIANLVWSFEWKAVDGDEISLEEKKEFTTVMKNPLQVHISPRIK